MSNRKHSIVVPTYLCAWVIVWAISGALSRVELTNDGIENLDPLFASYGSSWTEIAIHVFG